MRIAVIGTGIAGNGAAWALAQQHEVVVYEREERIGGHANTALIDYGGTPIAVDTGFIVYNETNYPNLTALFRLLGVPTQPSDMSFSVSIGEGAREWKGGTRLLRGLLAQPTNALSPRFLRMVSDILRFNRVAEGDLAGQRLAGLSLGDWLTQRRLSPCFVSDYILPMGAAIWSTPQDAMLDFPAESFLAFFSNHGLTTLEPRPWRTVAGGSRTYVEALTRPFLQVVRRGSPVVAVAREPDRVTVTDVFGNSDRFDRVVIATHADEALAMLERPSEAERSILGSIRYRPNHAVLHRDPGLMPRRRAAWAAWNFLSWPTEDPLAARVSVTYWMNALQGIPADKPLFVSLNPPRPPRPELTFGHFTYAHPQFDAAAFAAQRRLPAIQGAGGVHFCGAWTGFGFHEDGLASGLAAAAALGADIPWRGGDRPVSAAAAA